MTTAPVVAIAGITGALGKLISGELRSQGTAVRGLVRAGTSPSRTEALSDNGVEIVTVDFNDVPSMTSALKGASCVVSTIQGLEDVIITTQGKLLQAAVDAKVTRFIPSDYSLDFTKTRPGSNRNLDLRRRFHSQLDKSGIAWTSILNGAFMDMMKGEMSPINLKTHKIMYVGGTAQKLDYTCMQDIAAYTAAAAVDPNPLPKVLRIAGDCLNADELAATVSRALGAPYKLSWMGGVKFHELLTIPILKFFGGKNEVFPVWQGLQYVVNMASGEGKLQPLDNDRYPHIRWTGIGEFLKRD